MKLSPSRWRLSALVVLAAATLGACGGVAQPEGWAAPAIEGEQLLYFPDHDVLASATLTNGTTASVEWTFPNDADVAQADIDLNAVYGDILKLDGIAYFADWNGRVYAVSADDGSLTWTTADRLTLTGSIVAGLASDSQRLFVATTEGRLYALDRTNGALSPGWPEGGRRFDKGIWASPVVAGDRLFVATMAGELHALATADGSDAWTQPFDAATGAIPDLTLLSDDVLFVPTLGKKVYFVNTADGTESYPAIETNEWVWTRPALGDDTAYFGDFSGSVHAVDITTGRERWVSKIGAKIKAGPALIGETLVVADREPAVTFLDAETGEQRGNRIPLSDAGTIRATVVASDGAAYILTTNGKLFRADPERLAVVEVPVTGAP